MRLKVSDNRRFLVREDGAPFFYLGDTAWELFHRLSREEADRYLQDQADKRFTVIQAVVLAEFDGLTEPNPYGHVPLFENDPARPNDAYFEHVDYIVDRAASLGMYIGMLPTWGDKVNKKWGAGPEGFTPENAAVYGEFLGRRYRDKPILWIVGGDRPVENERHIAVWRAMAAGLKRGEDGRHLMTFHPNGRHTSAEWFHDEPWLDFNMLQSGHAYKDLENYAMIAGDYARSPTKPCLDGEPRYEDHPVRQRPEEGWFDAYDVRKAAYWALFAGAHGHTYGCHDIWQFWQPGRRPVTQARTPWKEALSLPGAAQMQHARKLLLSRPFLDRLPDQSLLASDPGTGSDHVQATRAQDGSYAFIYSASGGPFTVDMNKLAGSTIQAYWYDPRAGTATPAGEFARAGTREWTPPSNGPGHDWVLVLDDAAKEYSAPGSS
jgi:hypothetical protein